jgi:uncharacterized protein YqhQ
MMRGRYSAAVAIRQYTGNLLIYEEELNPRLYANRLFQLPFLRGLLLLWDMLVLGTRMLAFSASASLPPQDVQQRPTRATRPPSAPDTGNREHAVAQTAASAPAVGQVGVRTLEAAPADTPAIGKVGLGVTLAFSLTIVVVVFFLTPLLIVKAAKPWLGDDWRSLLAEGVVRLVILLAYLWLIGRSKSVQRVFQYHGAEHKAINTFEAGQPLDVTHVRQASRVHTRCGTGFLLIVMVISILVFALVGHPTLALRVISRIVLIPVVASIAYELMRLGAANYRWRVVRWLLAPGLALQGLTTREPDDGQIECAIAALDRVLRRDGVAEIERVA